MKRLQVFCVVAALVFGVACFNDDCREINSECRGNHLYICDDEDNEWFVAWDCTDFGGHCAVVYGEADCY